MSSLYSRVLLPTLMLGLLLAAVAALVLLGNRRTSPNENNPGQIADPNNPQPGAPPELHGTPGSSNGVHDPAAHVLEEPPLDPKRIAACYLTHKGGAPFQAQVRFLPQIAPVEAMPGFEDVEDALRREGQPLPPTVQVMDQYSETRADVLGVKTRTLVSYRTYLNALDGRILAYDLGITSGGVPTRYVGFLSRKGVTVETYRGMVRVDQREVDGPRGTLIMPQELEFMHYVFVRKPDRKDPLLASFFVPELMNFVTLAARPMGRESLPFRGVNRECAKYEVRVSAGQAREGASSLQMLWFDVRDNTLLQRIDYQDGVPHAEYPHSERVDFSALEGLQHLAIRPPADMPAPRALPFELDREQRFTVRARDKVIGRVRLKFSKHPADRSGPVGYLSDATVELSTESGMRRELAQTRYDTALVPFAYFAQGEEAGDALAAYKLEATYRDGKFTLRQQRDVRGSEGAEPQALQVHGALDPVWGMPLERIDLDSEPAAIFQPRAQDVTSSRLLSAGTFLYDFNRVEHLIALASRLPLTETPAGKKPEDVAPVFQRAALFSIRRNQGAVALIGVRPEPRPERPQDDPELLGDLEEEGPPLCVATARSAALNCTLLLAPDGRLMQFTENYGTNEVTYTLDDPIMRRREANEKKLRGQQGPTLLRPPWF